MQFDQYPSCDFKFNSNYIYGLPNHTKKLVLEDTTNDRPFRLYNLDR